MISGLSLTDLRRTRVKSRRALRLSRDQPMKPWPLPLRTLYRFQGNLRLKKEGIVLKGWRNEATYTKGALRENVLLS